MIQNNPKESARRLYFQSNMSRKQIAEATGVNVRTIFDWVNQGDWLRAKDMVCNAPTFLTEQYYAQLTALNKNIATRTTSPYPTKDESEIMRRITTTLKAVKTKHTRADLVDTLTDFSAFAINHTPAIADQLQDVIGAYLEQLTGNGPAARLARIKTPRQAAEAYQAHIKDMLDYDPAEINSPVTEEQQQLDHQTELLQVAAGIKEPHPIPQFSAEPSKQEKEEPCTFYGVAWVDYIAQRGTSPLEMVRLMTLGATPHWLRPYRQPDADPFKLMKELADRNIQPEFFKEGIYGWQRPPALIQAITLYPNYNYSQTPLPPVANTQPAEDQSPNDPILQNNFGFVPALQTPTLSDAGA